jgi:hypothetical protein
VRVRLRYRNLQDGARYAFNVNLRDQDGTFVFTSVSTPSATIGPDPWFDRPQPEGVLETTCEIPPDFLNTHTYYASVSVVAWRAVLGDSLVQLEDVVAFTVHDSGSMTKEYNFVWHGPIRTRLRWTTELKETADDRQDPLRAGRLG